MFLPRSPLSQTSPGNKTVKLVSEVVFSVSLLHFTLSLSKRGDYASRPRLPAFFFKTVQHVHNKRFKSAPYSSTVCVRTIKR